MCTLPDIMRDLKKFTAYKITGQLWKILRKAGANGCFNLFKRAGEKFQQYKLAVLATG